MDNIVTPLLTVLVAAVFGYPIAYVWAQRQKHRELSVLAANEFYSLYGEFFAIWKLWNAALDRRSKDERWTERRWELLERAAAAEGRVEALLVRVSAERRLNDNAIATLGRFRQGYQTLRQSIKNEMPLAWHSSDHREYVAFKNLAAEFAHISVNDQRLLWSRGSAAKQLLDVTSNRWQSVWVSGDASKEVAAEP